MKEEKKKCDCAEMSCKKDCERKHTHKGFSCEKCKPKEDDVEKEYGVEAIVEEFSEYSKIDGLGLRCDECGRRYLGKPQLTQLCVSCKLRTTLTSLVEQVRRERDEETERKIKVYFGHIENDGVTGNPMKLTQEEIKNDLIKFLTPPKD